MSDRRAVAVCPTCMLRDYLWFVRRGFLPLGASTWRSFRLGYVSVEVRRAEGAEGRDGGSPRRDLS